MYPHLLDSGIYVVKYAYFPLKYCNEYLQRKDNYFIITIKKYMAFKLTN